MIKSVGSGSFLAAQGAPEDGARFVETGTPMFWVIRVDEGDPDYHWYAELTSGGLHLPDYSIYFPGSILTCLVTVTRPELPLCSSLAGMSQTRSVDSSRLDPIIDYSDASHIG